VSKIEKLIQKIFNCQQVSYNDAEKILLGLGYEVKVSGSHHVFRKDGYRHVTIKIRLQLLAYQLKDLEEALKDHGY
jgi:hypothetical protein